MGDVTPPSLGRGTRRAWGSTGVEADERMRRTMHLADIERFARRAAEAMALAVSTLASA